MSSAKAVMASQLPDHKLRVLAKGYTSTIYHHLSDSTRVIKVPDADNAQFHFDVERRVYERLDKPHRPSSILQYFGQDLDVPRGLVLERALLGDLYSHLSQVESIAPVIKRSWARQAAESLAYVHSQGVLHCDIHAANFFLDGDLNLKLGDFGAASVDGERPLMIYRASHQLWMKDSSGQWRRDISEASEIFALGCTLYSIETCDNMWEQEVEEDEIVRRLKDRQYPSLDDAFELGKIIEGCWWQRYTSMESLLADIPDEQEDTTRGNQKRTSY